MNKIAFFQKVTFQSRDHGRTTYFVNTRACVLTSCFRKYQLVCFEKESFVRYFNFYFVSLKLCFLINLSHNLTKMGKIT